MKETGPARAAIDEVIAREVSVAIERVASVAIERAASVVIAREVSVVIDKAASDSASRPIRCSAHWTRTKTV